MLEKSEVDLVLEVITHLTGYDLGVWGKLSIRQYEYPVWAVEWEEYCNTNDPECKHEERVLEFKDPRKAAECFVELRHKLSSSNSYYILGDELSDFEEKYNEKV